MKQLPNRVTEQIHRVTGTIELDKEPPRHDLLNAWIAVAAAVAVGAVLGLQDWQSVRDKPEFARYLCGCGRGVRAHAPVRQRPTSVPS
jgi:hypothetical protein